jgi:hypothetical protein
MMNKVRIRKRTYLRLEVGKQVNYLRNLLMQCATVPELAIVQPQLDAVHESLDELAELLPETIHGGHDRTTRKRSARAILLDRMDQLVTRVEAARLPAELIELAGFPLMGTRRNHAGAEVGKPIIRSVTAIGDGAVEVRFTVPEYDRVVTNLFEWSADEGATWQGGSYGKRSPQKLDGLPVRREVLIRMRSVASHGRFSMWSEAVRVFVV